MHARDASGRQVSLLNDTSYSRPLTYRTTNHYQTTRDCSPLPTTPELLRSDSYDSNASYDPVSPMTPAVYDFSRSPYEDYLSEKSSTLKRPCYVESSRTTSYNEEDNSNSSSIPDRSGKRYPCRYRDSHGCDKTFTTSGHASRHSKIHTAEKAVHCTYPACHKKFTRADNMKQHLETHFKEKSRCSTSSKSSTKSSSLSSSKRASISSRSTISQSSQASQDTAMWDADQYGIITEGAQVASSDGSWAMHSLTIPHMSRPGTVRTMSSGLDALAAIACQEGC